MLAFSQKTKHDLALRRPHQAAAGQAAGLQRRSEMDKPYWKENCDYNDMDKSKLHEALHSSVTGIFGWHRQKIVVRADCTGYASGYYAHTWRGVAVWLAPALIGDISWGDEEWLLSINPHQRGYAWGWLKKNRKRIMARAKRLVAKMGEGPGKLEFGNYYDNTAKCWKASRRKP